MGGVLEASIALEKNGVPFAGDIEFVNQKKAPPTGDNIHQTLWLLLGGMGLMLVGLYIHFRGRRKEA